jgi:hypothetical protein
MMRPSVVLYAAATLIVLLGIAHSYLGERYILMRLFKRDNLPKLFGGTAFTAGTLRFVWHLITVAWFGIAAVAVQASGATVDSRSVLQVLSVMAFVSGLLPLYFTRGKHLSWAVFFAVAALLWFASLRI